MKGKMILIITIFFSFQLGIAQDAVQIIKSSVQNFIEAPEIFSELTYSVYPTYGEKKPSEILTGKMIKYHDRYFTQLEKTIFVSSVPEKVFIKANTEEKAIRIERGENFQLDNPWQFLETVIDRFKTHEIEESSTHYLCTLTSDIISSLPFGKIELYVDKKTLLTVKQVYYLLIAQEYNDINGNKQIGNPRMEIEMSNIKKNLTKGQILKTNIQEYVKYSEDKYIPVNSFTNYEISQ